MKSKHILVFAAITFLFATHFIIAAPAFASACTSIATGNWNVAGTWSCPGDADGIPDSDDDVTIAAGHTVTATDNRTAKSITISTTAQLTVGASRTVTAADAVGGFVTVDGTLSGTDANSILRADSPTITNNSSITVQKFQFGRHQTNSGTQSLAGAGTWSSTEVRVLNFSKTILANDITFGVTTFVINGSGEDLDLGANMLTFAGGTFNYGTGTVAGTGTFRTQGTVTLNGSGTFSPPLEINSGTTTASGTLSGALAIANGAILQVAASGTVTALADVTVNGTLSGANGSSTFRTEGSAFTNNSSITVANFHFRKNGAQAVAGTGTWTGSSVLLINLTTLALSNSITFAVTTFTLNGAAETLNLGSNDLTFTGATFDRNGGTISGTGTLRTQGTVTLDAGGGSNFTAPFEVNSDTTTVSGQFNGAITVANGAVFHVNNSITVNAFNTVMVDGTLSGGNSTSTFRTEGSAFTNNGAVTVPKFEFRKNGAQAVAGTGTWTGSSLLLTNFTTLSLSNDIIFAVTSFTLNGNAETLDLGTNNLTFIGSTFDANNGAVNGTGTFRAQGTITLAAGSSGNFNPPIEVNSGTTTASGIFNGPIAVLLTATLAVANSSTLTVNGDTVLIGGFQLNQGSVVAGVNLTYSPTGRLIFNNSSGSYAVNSGHTYWPSVFGPSNVYVQGAGGITMNVTRTVNGLFQTAAAVNHASPNQLTLNGTVQINSGGIFNHSPFYGAASTLKYNCGCAYPRFNEWAATSGAGYPAHVQLSNNTTLDLGANGGTGTARQLSGNLTIDSGSTFEMAGTNPMTAALTVLGSVINNGTFNLSTSSGGNLNVGGDFTNNSPFKANNRLVKFNGSSAQTLSGVTIFDSLTLDNAAGLTLNSDITLNQILTLTNGDITTGSSTLHQSVTSTSSGNGDVVGNVKRAHTFTLGTTYSFGNPDNQITFTLINGAAPADMTIQLAKTAPFGLPDAIARVYDITPNGGSDYQATLQLRYTDAEATAAGIDEMEQSDLKLFRRTSSGSTFTWNRQAATTANTTSNFATLVQVAAFSPWALSTTTSSPTDATLLAFRAKYRTTGSVRVKWQTGSELALVGFNVWRQDVTKNSAGTRAWKKLNTQLLPAKNPGEIVGAKYRFRDPKVQSGNTYRYKLELVRADGSSEWSETVRVNVP